jgi:hypothetical protein
VKSHQHVLVVDADIACAAGPDPKKRPWSDVAKACHDVLNAIWTCRGYRVAFDRTLRAEWKDHQGRTGRAWFVRMLSARRLEMVHDDTTQWVSDLIQVLPARDRPTAMKDRHLVALAHDPGDKRLLSNDGRARDKFRQLPDPRVSEIHWVASSTEAEKWLIDGATDKPEWKLAYQGGDE